MAEPAAPEVEIGPPSLSQLFLAFLRLGLTAFGGPAMVAYIGELAVDKHKWLSRPSFKEGVAVAQTIPGATAMQVAGYVGLRCRGVAGAAMAYVGFGLPAFVFMMALSALYGVTQKSPISVSIFQGLQVIVVAIVARAVYTFGRSTVKVWQDVVIGLAAAAYLYLGGHPMLAIAIAALAGLLLYRSGAGAGQGASAHEGPPLASTTRPVVLIVLGLLLGLAVLWVWARDLFGLSALMLSIDLFAFGGGFASLPLMLHEVVGVRHWVSTQAFMDGIAMGQVTPGPIVITATFIGYQLAGPLGAVCATVSVFSPSFVMLSLAVPHYDRMKANPWFQRATRGILASFVGLLLSVVIKFALATAWTPVLAGLGLAAFVALMFRVEVLWVVLPGAALAALLHR
jgi:chromate transporter